MENLWSEYKYFFHENRFSIVVYFNGWVHADVITWKRFPHYWPFMSGIHQWLLNSSHKEKLWNFRVCFHDDVIKWKHFPRNWPFVRGIHRSPVNSPQKGQWRGALMFILICARINGWVNTREAGDLRRYRPHYDVIVMCFYSDTLSNERSSCGWFAMPWRPWDFTVMFHW